MGQDYKPDTDRATIARVEFGKWREWVRTATDSELKAERGRLAKPGASRDWQRWQIVNGTLAQRNSKHGVNMRGTRKAPNISVVRSYRLQLDLVERCEKAAQRLGVNVSDFVRRALDNECYDVENN